MSDHYYTSKPTAEHDLKQFDFKLRGRAFTFTTDAGVFSKERIDYGSVVLIEQMEIAPSADVLDIGCGYGPIGIVAATLATNGQVTMVDLNERAVELANNNIKANNIHNAKAYVSNLLEHVPPEQTFDVILTNPPIRAGKQTVHEIFEQAYSRLNKNGSLWVVIQKKQGAPSAMDKLEQLFGQSNVKKVIQDKGYWIIKGTKTVNGSLEIN